MSTEPKKHRKHDEIAKFGREKRNKAFIKKQCKVSWETIDKVYALEGIEHNPSGVQSAPDTPLHPPNDGTASLWVQQINVLTGKAECHDCAAPLPATEGACNSWRAIGGLGYAYAMACPDCAEYRKHLMPNTPLGRKRMERIALDWFYGAGKQPAIANQIKAIEAAEIGYCAVGVQWYDESGDSQEVHVSDATYPDGPYFHDEQGKRPMTQADYEKWLAYTPPRNNSADT